MVELSGALQDLETPVRWRDLAVKHRELLGQAPAEDALATETSRRRVGWVWRNLRRVLAVADGPVTPRQAHALLEAQLGESIPYSTVKGCLSNHVRAGHLERVGRGRYVLVDRRRDADQEGSWPRGELLRDEQDRDANLGWVVERDVERLGTTVRS